MLRCPLSTRVRSIGRWLRSGERGQAIWWVLLMVPLFAVGGAIVIDSSIWYGHRRAYQNTADAAALAGAQELIDRTDSAAAMSASASAKADEWRVLNEHPPVDFESGFPEVVNDCWGPTSYDLKPDGVAVGVSKDAPLLFMKTVAQGLGIEIGGYAKACVGSLAGVSGLRPWALPRYTSPCFENVGGTYVPLFGETCVLRDDTPPNTQAIDLGRSPQDECGDGHGANDYRNNIVEGSPAWCSVGDTVFTEPGLMTGPTLRRGMQDLLSSEGASDGCDARFGNGDHIDQFGETVTPPDATPSPDTVYSLRDCTTPRLVHVAIVDTIPSGGSKPVTIRGFATFFIEGCQRLNNQGNPTGPVDPKCNVGNSFQILGTFVQLLELEGTGGPLDPFGVRVISLIE